GAGAGVDTITATLIGGYAGGNAQTFDLTYTTAATSAAAVLTLDDNQVAASSNVRLDSHTLPSWNEYATAGKSAPTTDANNFVVAATTGVSNTTLTLSGIVTNASNVGVEGVPVTVSATGITFKYTDGNGKVRFSRDSITVLSAAGGSYSVSAYSDAKGGSVVFTAAAGTLSKTTTVTFDTGVASAIALTTGSAAILPGQTVDVTVKITDATGAAVKGIAVSLKNLGAGYLNAQSGTTDAAGEVVVKLITGPADSGTATISATASLAGVDTTKTATVTVSTPEPSAVVNVVGHRVYVKFANAKGEEVSAVIGGVRITKTATYDNYVVSRWIKNPGKYSVKAYVAGDLVKAATVTVK
ncbi:hypothetical protein, partial [Rhodoluna sp.]|uniref:hypothetical protein n=1 Tax=Rhodoluna sp. TaxID=1969481 RepID=UPI0025F481D2